MNALARNGAMVGLVTVLVVGCGGEPEPEPESTVQIPNPASEYCVAQGGRVEIVTDSTGQKGMCHLADGTVVEEWELYRRDHAEAGDSGAAGVAVDSVE